jgi:hypothetical protein
MNRLLRIRQIYEEASFQEPLNPQHFFLHSCSRNVCYGDGSGQVAINVAKNCKIKCQVKNHNFSIVS